VTSPSCPVRMHSASKMGKPGRIEVLRNVGVLEVGGEKRAAAKVAAASCSAAAISSGAAIRAAAGDRVSRDRAIRKAQAMIPDLKMKSEGKTSYEGLCRRWVHVHREAEPGSGVAFHVHRDSRVCELLPKIGKWYGLNVSEFSLHESNSTRRLAGDTPWKDVALWGIGGNGEER
jgi:hypothetical protein